MLDQEKKQYPKRLTFFLGVIILIFAVLIGRLWYLQILNGELYERLAEGNRIRLIPILAPRGNIYDRNGIPLVTSRPAFEVSLLAVDKPISQEVLVKLAEILDMPPEEIEQKSKQTTAGFEPIRIKSDISPETVAKIEERRSELPGVVIEIQPVRNYVYNELAVHALGYVSEINEVELENLKKSGYKLGDLIGKFGLEKTYDKSLKGIDGGGQVEVDVTGRPIQVLGKKDPVPGHNIFLTIDYNIQVATEKAIDEHLSRVRAVTDATNAYSAAVIVINPKNGEILAMASRPNFDPNLFPGGISHKEWNKINNDPHKPMENKVISGEYPPGSTFKVVTGTAALELGKVTPGELIFDSGKHWIIPKTNSGGVALGLINFQEALAKSNNVFFYEMGNRLGIDNLEKYARMFGLGELTGIDLPGEMEGLVASRAYKERNYKEDWYIAETFDAAIGQGFQLATPIQIVMLIMQVANDGTYYKPHLVSKITDNNNHIIKSFNAEAIRKLNVSHKTLQLIRASLRDASTIDDGTSASHFRDFPIKVAGKTGTAENPHGKDHALFMAFAPYDDPEIAIIVLIPQGGYGSVAAAPIAKRIMEVIFNVPPPPPPPPPVKEENSEQTNQAD